MNYRRPYALRSLFFAVFLLALCSLPLAAHGQSATATVSGTVEDQNGAVVPGVNISIQNTATSLERQATTNESGYFTVPLLSPGTYTITARRDGFTTAQIRDVVLNVGDQKGFKISLRTGDISETVNVTSESPLISESPAVGTVVDRQFVANIPMNGRSFHSLISLSPGVVLAKGAHNNQGQFSVNGQRTGANYFTIDGVGANFGSSASAQISQSAGGGTPALAATGGTNNLVSIDALQEFKIQTSTYAAEFGRMPGAQVSISTRSGTNDFHGLVFDYLRNDAFDANDWFANRSGLKRPPLRQNDFGGVFGGPILKNRTFFFFSYEGLRLLQPLVASAISVPSLAARLAAPTAIRPFLNAYAVPNGPDIGDGLAQFSASYANRIRLDSTSIRIDHVLSKNVSLFGRYSHAPSHSVTRRATTPNVLQTSPANTTTFTVGTTYVVRPKVINDFRLNYSAANVGAAFTLDNFGGATPFDDSLLFPAYTNRNEALAGFGVGAPGSLLIGPNSNNFQRQLNLIDTLSVVAGSHELKFGVDYRTLSPTIGGLLYTIGIDFTGVAGPGGTTPSGTALSGQISFGSVTHRAGNTYPKFTNLSLFAQDTWKARRRLTLTYGLRWELNPPPTARDERGPVTAIGLENPATMTLSEQGKPLWKTTYNNFAPRFGVVYLLSQRNGRETVLRGGAGIFYDLGTGQAAGGFGGHPYLIGKFFSAGTPFPLTTAQLEAPDYNPAARPVSSIYAFGPDLKVPRTYQWNFAVEQSLGSSQTFTAGYVGASGRKLLRQETLVNPNSTFATVRVTNNSATSDYHSLQLQFQRRLTRGLQALASYTLGKSVDTASDDATLLTPSAIIDPEIDRGPSDFDIRHSFSAAVTYDIPFPYQNRAAKALLGHWSLDTIFRARSAPPVNVTVSGNNGFGNFSFRPDLVPGIPLYLDDPAVGGGRRFNNSVVAGSPNQRGPFILPTTARQGTLGRNALRGFPFYQLDVGLRRQFNLGERFYLQLRGEAFNILNHPNFADPLGTLGTFSATRVLTVNPAFGQSSQMLGKSLGDASFGGFNPLYQFGGPRSFQLSLKFGF